MSLAIQITTDIVIHEVTETTRLKLSHGDTLGTTSFVLTTETVRSGAGEGTRRPAEEKPRPSIDNAASSESDDHLLSQLKEVRPSEEGTQPGPGYYYHQHVPRHAVKGIL